MKNILLIICLCGFCLGCSDYSPGNPAAMQQEIKNFSVSEIEFGVVMWTLTADYAQMNASNTVVTLKDPVMKFYENNVLSSQLSADEGFVDMDKKDVSLKNNVKVNSYAKETALEAKELFYSGGKDLIWSDTEVKMTQDDLIIDGKGFESKPDLSEIVIRNQTTQIPEEKDKLPL